MKQIDDLFRDGLGGRKSAVPEDMWSRINAAKPTVPVGEQVDNVFAAGLRDRVGEVPTGMWDRIVAARGRKPAKTMLLALAGLFLLLATTFVGYNLFESGYFTAPVEEVSPDGQPAVNSDQPLAATEAASVRTPTTIEATTVRNSLDETVLTDVNTAAENTSGAIATTATELDQAGTPTLVLAQEPGGIVLSDESTTGTITAVASSSEANPETLVEIGSALVDRMAVTEVEIVETAPLSLLPTKKIAFPEIKRQYRPRANLTPAFRASPRHRFQGELLFGLAYANQMFREADESQRLLRGVREVSEFPEVSYQITLRGTYKMGERMLLLGGLTYAEIRNRVEYSQFLNGRFADVVTNNQIRLLEAPLLLGYRIPGRRLQVSINAGPVVNLSTAARGRFLNPDVGQPLDLATDGNYRKNIGIGFMTSLSTTYRIGHDEPFLLVVEPFFKTYPGAFTVKGAPVREKYWVAGLQLGVRKGF